MSGFKRACAALAVSTALALVATGSVCAADATGTPSIKAGQKKVSADKQTAGTSAAPVRVPTLSAAAVLERHIAARGGVSAWKAVQALQLSGKMEAGKGDNNSRAMKMVESSKRVNGRGTNAEIAAASGPQVAEKQIELPFTLDLQRPNKSRLEIQFAGKTAVQVYDGTNGWKLRPFLNRQEAEPFTQDEAKIEAARDDLDGPLVGAAAHGDKVDLEGADLVDGQPAYRLKVTRKGGDVKHVWIDAKSFLDVKMSGFSRRMDGTLHNVYVYQRDFRKIEGGVTIPFLLETTVEGYADTHKMTIEKAMVNPRLDETLFAKPHV